MAKAHGIPRSARLIPGILAGIIAIIMLIGGVSGSLVAGELDKILNEPYRSLVIWGVFGIAVIVASVSAIWGLRRSDQTTGDTINIENVGTSGPGSQATAQVAQGDIYNIHQAQQLPAATTALHQLPRPSDDFTGREAELAELLDKIREGGVAISGLRGMGGIGKTALALVLADELAPQYPDAQFYLDLQGTSPQPLTPADAMAHVIRSFNREIALPENEGELRGLYQSVLYGQRALLLMDNAADAQQVQPLVPPEDCVLLVTSRQRFDLPGLHSVDLGTLSPEESRALLLQIAPRIGDQADAIAELCGYLPMALELAARPLNQRFDLTPEDYLLRLAESQQRFKEVDASLSLSYNLLTPELQGSWRTLAVFPGSFEIKAVAAVWEMESGSAQNCLGALLIYNLINWDPDLRRYRLHDLARDLADSLLEVEERPETQYRHAGHFRGVLLAANQLYLEGGEEQMRALALFDLEWGNIQAGQAWAQARAGEDDAAAALCSDFAGAGSLLDLRQHPQEQVCWLEEALGAARRLKDRPAEAGHLGNLGIAHVHLGDLRRAIEYYEQVLVICRDLGDRNVEGTTLGNLGNAFRDLGQHHRAIEYHEQALVISREIGDRRGEGNALGGLGIVYAELGEPRRAIEYHERRLSIAREIGDRRGEGNALGNLGSAYGDLGELRRTIEYHEQHLKITREIDDRRGEGDALGNLGNGYARLREPRRAIEYYEQQLEITREMGDRRGEGHALWNMSLALDQLGDRTQADQRAEAALRVMEEIEHPFTDTVRERLAQWRGEGEGKTDS